MRKTTSYFGNHSVCVVLQTSVIISPDTLAPLKSHPQSEWLSKLPATLSWFHGKESFLYVQIATLHHVLWDPLLLDFPILATCSQVVIKELNHWTNQPTLFSRTTLNGRLRAERIERVNNVCIGFQLDELLLLVWTEHQSWRIWLCLWKPMTLSAWQTFLPVTLK